MRGIAREIEGGRFNLIAYPVYYFFLVAAKGEATMGKFLESEKPHQARFKQTAPYFSEAARADGLYKTSYRPYCLPRDVCEENLLPAIRRTAAAHFASQAIKWHDGINRRPSNHLCDSQVCCVNFLFPFANEPEALAALLRPQFPALGRMLEIENGLFVTFEWIGEKNYLLSLEKQTSAHVP